jgi:hypothetical protein
MGDWDPKTGQVRFSSTPASPTQRHCWILVLQGQTALPPRSNSRHKTSSNKHHLTMYSDHNAPPGPLQGQSEETIGPFDCWSVVEEAISDRLSAFSQANRSPIRPIRNSPFSTSSFRVFSVFGGSVTRSAHLRLKSASICAICGHTPPLSLIRPAQPGFVPSRES